MKISFVSTHEKLHLAQLWQLPDCGADLGKSLFFTLYRAAVEQGKFPEGTPVNFSIPAADRGFLLSGLAAAEDGLPVNRLIAASNENRVVTDFLRTAVYAPRPVVATKASLLDLGVSREAEALASRSETAWQARFAAYSCPQPRWENMRKKVWESCAVRLSPSTAVAYVALQDHRCVTADGLQAIVLSLEEPE